MARSTTNSGAGSILPDGAGQFLKRRACEIIGISLVLNGLLILVALVSYVPSDPSFNSAAAAEPHNLLGLSGAYLADFLLQSIGLVGAAPSLVLAIWGVQTIRKRPPKMIWVRFSLFLLTIMMASMSLSALPVHSDWPLVTSLGGVIGMILLDRSMVLLSNATVFLGIPFVLESWMLALFMTLPALAALITVLGLSAKNGVKPKTSCLALEGIV